MNLLNLSSAIIAQVSYDTPHTIVFWAFVAIAFISFVLSLFLPSFQSLWKNFKGTGDANGMHRLVVFNRQPYLMVLHLTLAIVVSGCIGALLLFIVGGIGYGLLWAVKIILWCIIIIGWICAIVGILGLLGRQGWGCLSLIVGGLIVYFQDNLKWAGNYCVETGFSFYETLNIWGFCKELVSMYGLTFLFIASTPILIGAGVAIIVLLCSLVFWIVETVMTRSYNIKHPCPFCHNPSEPAVYLSNGVKLPVKLRPGVYGLFHITHPQTGEKMPTMLLNGRDNLSRECPHCGKIISYHTGIEKHIAFVGLPESGKTCLTYRFVGNLMRTYPRIEFTDKVSNEAKKIITDIRNGNEQELASKTSVADMRRSLQVIAPGKGPLPYHLFINDVGGELFTTAGVDSSNVQFFKDVESVSILIDPFTMDFKGYDLGKEFAEWYKQNVENSDSAIQKEKMSGVIDTVKFMSDHFVHSTNKIHMNIVLVKIDSGYVTKDIVNDEAKIREFVTEQLGLIAEVSNLEGMYASLHFYAVSALKNIGIQEFTSGIINELNIKL